MLAFAEQLHALIEAPYPYLYLVSFEEERVVTTLTRLTTALQRPLEIWRPETHDDPSGAFDGLLAQLTNATPNSVHLAIDAHPYLRSADRIRRMRVLQSALTRRGATLIFVSPVPTEPVELAKDWVTLDVPLPDQEELLLVLERSAPAADFPTLDRARISSAALGLTGREALRAFERARHLDALDTARRRATDWESVIIREKQRLMRGAGALELGAPGVSLGDVGGLETLKQWVEDRGRAFSAEARAYGLPTPRGLLMLGVQGCGKSLAAKAIAGNWGIPLLRLDLGALFGGDVAPDTALRAACRAAEAMSPCVLWVDEIEKAFGDADGDTARLMGSLLTWLQEKSQPVFFVATANEVESLPPELMRRGRFDEIFFVDLPDKKARTSILGIHLRARDRDPADFDLSGVLSHSENYSGAELEQVVIDALYSAFAADREVTQGDLETATRRLVPLYALRETEIKALRTWADGRARPAGINRKLADLFG